MGNIATAFIIYTFPS